MIKIVGSYLSPYVRKVLVCLELKGIDYEIDPIVPFYGNDDFSEISPVRRIPVLVDDQLVIPDSTIICEYLEDQHPAPALYPDSPALRSRARWLEEYADSRMGEVFIWRYCNEIVIRRFVWGEQSDSDTLKRAVSEEIPGILDYLEQQLPNSGLLLGKLSVADIAIASFFRNLFLAGFDFDHERWQKTHRFVTKMHGLPAFKKLLPFEEISAKTPIPNHRKALTEAGAPIVEETYFEDRPRRGILST